MSNAGRSGGEAQLYAQAGVPHYLRIEQGEAGPGAVVYRLKQDRYTEVARVVPG